MKNLKLIIPFYHNHTKACVALTNVQAEEELHHEQIVLGQAGQGIEMNYYSLMWNCCAMLLPSKGLPLQP